MSGGILPLFTNVNPTPLWGSGGGASNVSTFATASVSSLTCSTITTGSLTASSAAAALLRGASIYTSTTSGTVGVGASTLLFSVPNDGNGGGVFVVSAESDVAASGGINVATMFTSYTRASNGYSTGAVVATNNIASYDISPEYSISSSNPTQVWFANNGSNPLSYTAFLTRLGN